MKQIRVLVADDRALIRGGIRALLEERPELQIVAEASDGPEALRLIRVVPTLINPLWRSQGDVGDDQL